MQSIDSIETYANGMRKDLVSEKQGIKCNNIINRYKKWYKLWYVIKEKRKKPNLNWPGIPDHPYRILIIRASRSGKTNTLLNLINHEPDID